MKNLSITTLLCTLLLFVSGFTNGQCTLNATISESNDPICLGEEVTISINIISGSPPFTYNWNDGQYTTASITVSPIETSEYLCIVTDAYGFACSLWLESTIQVNNSPAIVVSDVGATTCGVNNGFTTVFDDVLYDLPTPTEFAWSNGETTQTISSLAAGIYTVTATNLFGCQSSLSVNIEPSDGVLGTPVIENTSCGLDNGNMSIDLMSSGSVFYQWSNGATSSAIYDLPAGDYNVTITSDVGCEANLFGSVGASLVFEGSVSAINTTCGQNNGQATLTISGGIPSTYLWSTGATTDVAYDLQPGQHSVTVTSQDNCQSIVYTEIASSLPFEVNPMIENTTCGQDNGAINLAFVGDVVNTIQWSNGISNSNMITQLQEGQYNVTAVSVNMCLATATMIVESSIPLTIEKSSTPATCSGCMNGTASVTASGATNYTYRWSNGATTQSITNLAAGLYLVTVTGDNGCIDVAEIVVEELVATHNITVGNVQIVPNPISGQFVIKTNNEIKEIIISDLLGRKLYSASSLDTIIDISSLQSGQYLLTVSMQEGKVTRKIIKI